MSHVRIEGDCWTWTGPVRRHNGGDRPSLSMRQPGAKHPITGKQANPRNFNAARVMCELIQGPAPERHEASHLCEGGDYLCICPDHLVWETASQNCQRREAVRRARLLEPDVYATGVVATDEEPPF